LLNSVLLFVVITGGITLASVLGLLLVRRKWNTLRSPQHHEVGGYMLSILATLYAVVLGFIVVDVSDNVHQAKANIEAEVNAMLNICTFADGLPDRDKIAIGTACVDYSNAVVDHEWEGMADGKLSPETYLAIRNIWGAIKNCNPANDKEQSFYQAILDNYNSMLSSRRTRLVTAIGYVSPIMWLVLIGGGITTIGFTYFFSTHSLRSQMVMTALVSITLALNLYLIVVNSNPFAGELKIRPQAFKLAARMLMMKGKCPPPAAMQQKLERIF
jgi:hypothetical protein